MAIPKQDSLLVPLATSWATHIQTGYETYGITEQQSADFMAVQAPYLAAVAAMNNARSIGTRAKIQTVAKDSAKTALLAVMRSLYGMVQANVAVSDVNKQALGIVIRSNSPKPVPTPTAAPAVRVNNVYSRTMNVSVYDPTRQSKRGRLPTADGANVYRYAGSAPPADTALWTYVGRSTKLTFDVTFPADTPSGQTVWVCAAWVNRTDEMGPSSLPVSANLPGGSAVPATQTGMKVAA